MVLEKYTGGRLSPSRKDPPCSYDSQCAAFYSCCEDLRPGSDLDLLIEIDRPPRISLIGLVELDFVEDILDWLNKAEILLS
jgi:hypothetical protein